MHVVILFKTRALVEFLLATVLGLWLPAYNMHSVEKG